MALASVVVSRRDEIPRIARKHGVRSVRVFGSAARGDVGPESDIDFLVEVGPAHSPWFPGGLLVELQALLGRNVDVVEREGLHWFIRDRVLEEAVPL